MCVPLCLFEMRVWCTHLRTYLYGLGICCVHSYHGVCVYVQFYCILGRFGARLVEHTTLVSVDYLPKFFLLI